MIMGIKITMPWSWVWWYNGDHENDDTMVIIDPMMSGDCDVDGSSVTFSGFNVWGEKCFLLLLRSIFLIGVKSEKYLTFDQDFK